MVRKTGTIMMVAVVAVSLILAATGPAWGHGGWYGAGAFAGGLLLGAAIAGPWYAPPPVYVYPAPRVVYAPAPLYMPNEAYAYPDPILSQEARNQASQGEWVMVPGQSVSGIWVPPHRVWVSRIQ